MLKEILIKISAISQRISQHFGQLAAWFSIALVFLICIDVFMRYTLGITKIWILDLEIYFFALIFLFGGANTFAEDRHVRVDLFYAKWSARRKAWVDLLGTLLLLMPWCVVILQVAWHYALAAYTIGERSEQTGGLAGLYILKFCLFISFALLFIQALGSIANALLFLFLDHKPPQHELEQNIKEI